MNSKSQEPLYLPPLSHLFADNKQRPLLWLASHLIQAARSSKLDQAGLREYLKGLKENYFKEVGSTAEEWSNVQQVPRTTFFLLLPCLCRPLRRQQTEATVPVGQPLDPGCSEFQAGPTGLPQGPQRKLLQRGWLNCKRVIKYTADPKNHILSLLPPLSQPL